MTQSNPCPSSAWLLVHIIFLIGFRDKLAVLLGWSCAYLVNTPEARIIVHPPAVPAPDKRG